MMAVAACAINIDNASLPGAERRNTVKGAHTRHNVSACKANGIARQVLPLRGCARAVRGGCRNGMLYRSPDNRRAGRNNIPFMPLAMFRLMA